MSDEEIYELLRGDVDSKDAFEAIDEMLARKPKSEHIVEAMEHVLDGGSKKEYAHLSWPATFMHILARALEDV